MMTVIESDHTQSNIKTLEPKLIDTTLLCINAEL